MKILSILIPELRVIADICTGTHTSKFMCAIYCTYEIINMFQKVLTMTGIKLTIGRLSLIGIY